MMGFGVGGIETTRVTTNQPLAKHTQEYQRYREHKTVIFQGILKFTLTQYR
jgi:hypothetical protein